MQLSTGDAAPQQPAAAPAPEAAAGGPVTEGPAPQPADGGQSLANGDVSGGADDAPATAAPDAADQPGAAEDAEDVDVDMDIDPSSGALFGDDAVWWPLGKAVASNSRTSHHPFSGLSL